MNAKTLVRYEQQLFRVIGAQQRTLRLIKLIPSWEVFMQTEAFFELRKVLDGVEMRKYRATWRMFFELMRDEKDNASILCATVYLVAERAHRQYAKVLTVKPEAWNIPPEHATKIKEFVQTHYEDLNPF